MSVSMDMWRFVVEAFQELKSYEINEFGPQTTYLSPYEARKLSLKEFKEWCEKFRSEFLAERRFKRHHKTGRSSSHCGWNDASMRRSQIIDNERNRCGIRLFD